MIQKKKILAIIPARGGSKRVPKKNIRLLTGKPLIAYTIETALKSRYLNRIVVSTEDEEIARISKKYGAEVVKRPQKLATDRAKTIDAIFHVLSILKEEHYNPQVVVLLQPTSPLRTENDIDKAIKLFLSKKVDSVISVCEAEHSPYWDFRINSDGFLEPFIKSQYLHKRHQDIPKIYSPNGAVYIAKPKTLYKYKTFCCKKTFPYSMPVERSIDIDTEIDLMLAELIKNKIIKIREFEGQNQF